MQLVDVLKESCNFADSFFRFYFFLYFNALLFFIFYRLIDYLSISLSFAVLFLFFLVKIDELF